MEVIPSINCTDEVSATALAKRLASLPVQRVHIDVSDGIFTPVLTWNDPRAAQRLFNDFLRIVHLMVQDPLPYARAWAESGASGIIVHAEVLTASGLTIKTLRSVLHDTIQIGVSLTIESPIATVLPYIADASFVQVLSVPAGASGSVFDERAIHTVQKIRQQFPDAILEVDGGITPTIARTLKAVGVSRVVVGSYVWGQNRERDAIREFDIL